MTPYDTLEEGVLVALYSDGDFSDSGAVTYSKEKWPALTGLSGPFSILYPLA